MDNAFRYIEANHGLDTEECYRYEAHVSHIASVTALCVCEIHRMKRATTAHLVLELLLAVTEMLNMIQRHPYRVLSCQLDQFL